MEGNATDRPRAVDRYEKERLLGQGGAGRVWLVRDRSRGRTRMALKELAESSRGRETGLRQEFALLTSLRHPNLVAVHTLDLAPDTALPRFSLEYIDGVDLITAVRREGPGAFAVLAAETLRALSFLHDFGLIHRDLKPANLLVRRQPHLGCRVVLLDFGLALRGGNEEAAGGAVPGPAGTLPYLAPELLDGQAPDRRSDLYALGALLYEAVHDRPAFVPDETDLTAFVAAVREGKRARPPLPEGYPPRVAEWFESLINPNPASRPRDAREALAQLNAAGGYSLPLEIPATRAARLASGRPVGRDGELTALWNQLTVREAPCLIWLAGGAGSGKTRILRWLASDAVTRGWEVISAGATPPAAGYETWLRELRDRAARKPTLLLLDELERASRARVRLVERVAHEGKAPPLRVVAALRPGETHQPVLRGLLRDSEVIPTLRRIELDVLGEPAVRAFAERATGSRTVSEARVRWLTEHGEGNPLITESLLVDAAWEHGGRRASASRTIRRSAAGRLSLLTDPALRCLRAVSVLDRSCSVAEVANLSDLREEQAATAVGEAAAAGLVREVEGHWTVESREVRRLALQGLDRPEQRVLHERAAAWEAELPEAGIDLRLARLWLAAGKSPRALDHALRVAGAAADEASDPALAAEALMVALRCLPRRDPRRFELRMRLAQSQLDAGLFQEACRSGSAAVRLAADDEGRARALSLHGQALMVAGRFDRAVERVQRAVELEAPGAPGTRGRCLKVWGSALGRLSRDEEAVPLLEEAIGLLEQAGDRRTLAEAHQNLAICKSRSMRPDALEHYQQSRRIAHDVGYTRHEVYSLISLAGEYRRRGRREPARQALEEAHRLALDMHPSTALHIVQASLANEASDAGRFDAAVDLDREAEEGAWHFADVNHAVIAGTNRATALLACGRGREAADIARRLLSSVARERVEPSRIEILRLTLAEALGSMGEHRQAGEIVAEVKESCRKRRDEWALLWALVIELERCALPDCPDACGPIRREYEALIARKERVGPEPRIRADLAWARCHLKRGRVSDCPGLARRALQAARQAGLDHLAVAAAATLGQALARSGLESEAAEVVREARERLQTLAERIDERELRRDFLRRPEFAALGDMAGNEGAASDRRLRALYEMIRALNSQSDPESLLESMLDMAIGAVDAERGLILLRELGAEDRFSVRAARNSDRETERDAQAYSRGIATQAGRGESILAVDAGTDERFRDLRSVSLYDIRSLMCVPLRSRGRIVGTVYLDSRRDGRLFREQDLRFVEAFADHAALALENARARAALEDENRRLRVAAGERVRFDNIIGRSPAMQRVFDLIEKVAASELPVLILGESGTGKELVARSIHAHGSRKDRGFLTENCAAIPETLLESELFGHVRGAFTGAERDRAGLFEQADGGTLFLDEIGDMSPGMQARLLRVLQEGELRRVGDDRTITVDVRVLAATHRDLPRRVREGRFREDLLYRLQVLTIQLPPLRERPGDVGLLVGHLLERISRERGRPAPTIENEVLEQLERYDWPGNVRQLENVIQRLALLAGDGAITRTLVESDGALRQALSPRRPSEDKAVFSLQQNEREQIKLALEAAGGNRNRAARMLGISRATIYRKIKEHELR